MQLSTPPQPNAASPQSTKALPSIGLIKAPESGRTTEMNEWRELGSGEGTLNVCKGLSPEAEG